MFNWFKSKDKVKLVTEARRKIIEFNQTHNMMNLIPLFDSYYCRHPYLKYSMEEIHVGSFLHTFRKLTIEIDIKLTKSSGHWLYAVDPRYHTFLINETQINNEKEAINALVGGLVVYMGYVVPKGMSDCEEVYLPYKLGKYISESA